MSWRIELKNWDPNYTPTSNTDIGGTPVTTLIDSGTTGFDDAELSYATKSVIQGYYNPTFIAGKTVYYVMRNRNQRVNGHVDVVYADPSPIKSYSY